MSRVNLTNYFHSSLFIPEMKATNKDEALEELLNLFVREKLVKNKKLVLAMLKQREKLGSTGIGKGVAIPHGRTTAAGDVMIAFGKSSKGIPFDAIDKQPVHLFFMVIAHPQEKSNEYLPLLGSLVTTLKDDNKREQLMHVANFEDLLAVFQGE